MKKGRSCDLLQLRFSLCPRFNVACSDKTLIFCGSMVDVQWKKGRAVFEEVQTTAL